MTPDQTALLAAADMMQDAARDMQHAADFLAQSIRAFGSPTLVTAASKSGCGDDCPQPVAVKACEWCGFEHRCGQKDPSGFICTRQDGHEGEHVSCTWGAHGLTRWPNTEQPAVDTPANSETAERETAEVQEWPKWTQSRPESCGRVRMWASQNVGYTFIDGWFESQLDSLAEDLNSASTITRAAAVSLIGEAAVAEGERLAGVRP